MPRAEAQPRAPGKPLEKIMGVWECEVSPAAPGIGRLVNRTVQGSKLSVVVSVAYFSILLRGIVMAGSMEEVKLLSRLMCGAYSTVAAQFILFFHRHHAVAALRIARGLASQLEENADAEAAARMRRAARLIRGIKTFLLVFSINGTFSVVLTALLAFEFDSVLNILRESIMIVGMVFCSWAFYVVLSLTLCAHLACCALYKEVGRRLQTNGGADELSYCARLHSQLKEAEQHMDCFVGMFFPHYLLVGVLLPLVSIAEVLTATGQADLYALSTLPFVFIVIVPLCFVGQYVADASAALPKCCYFGPWLEEGLEARRARLVVMKLGLRPDVVRVRALGKLNRRACASILRSWVSYLQVVVRLSSESQ